MTIFTRICLVGSIMSLLLFGTKPPISPVVVVVPAPKVIVTPPPVVDHEQLRTDIRNDVSTTLQAATDKQADNSRTEALARREDWIKSSIAPTIAALGALLLSWYNKKHIKSLNINVNGRITRLIELERADALARGIQHGRELERTKSPENQA